MPRIVDRDDMQAKILAAAQNVFAAKGLHTATIADVATAAGLGKGTLYLYFKNKDAIAEAMVARHFDTLESRLICDRQFETLEDFMQHLAACLEVPAKQARFIPAFFEIFGPSFASPTFTGQIAGFFARLGQFFAEALQDLQAKGAVRTDLDPAVTGRVLASLIDGMVLHRGLFGIPKAQYDPMRHEALALFLRGLTA